jgi:adenylosuccinate lyase
MPHKKNPILSENLVGIARLLRSYASAALEDVALWHERDISHSSVERVIGPDATGLADFMVRRAAGLVDGLVVNAARMRENLEQAKGLYFSEAVMLTLIRKGMARQAAYELVQRNALRAVAGEGKFRDLLAADEDVTARLDAAEIDRAFNLEHHLRHAGAIIDRALAEEAS